MSGRILALILAFPSALFAGDKLRSKAPPEMEQLRFLTGVWHCVVKGHATASESLEPAFKSSIISGASRNGWNPLTYIETGKGDGPVLVHGFLGWDASAKKFVAIGVSSTGTSMRSTSEGWKDNKLVWFGDGPTPSGTTLPSRSTYSMTGGGEMDILSEVSADSGAAWTMVRETHCKRTRSSGSIDSSIHH